MRKALPAVLMATISVLLAAGCSQGILDTKWGIEKTARKNTEAMRSINAGMALNDVVRMMEGEPYLADSYAGKKGEQILVYKYITSPTDDLGDIKEGNLTPFIFVNNVLDGWGWLHLETASKKYGFTVKARSL